MLLGLGQTRQELCSRSTLFLKGLEGNVLGARPTSITAMKFIVAHTLAFILALTAFALYIVSFNTPFYIIAKKCKFSLMQALSRVTFFAFHLHKIVGMLSFPLSDFSNHRLHQDD